MAAATLPVLALLLLSAASGVSPASIGINYGQVADNLPPPGSVVPLLRSLSASRVKLYDADPRVLRAFANTSVEFIVGLPDADVPRVVDRGAALAWVRSHIQPHIPATRISAVTVGNEVLTSNSTAAAAALVPAMESVHAALASLGLASTVGVTTAHSLSVLSASFPPSAAAFRHDLLPFVAPLLAFHARTGSPFLINAYPYFAYKADPRRVPLDYVLLQPAAAAVPDPGSGLRYANMLHAQVDAARAAIAAAGGKGVEIVVSETGWPSGGDADEAGATPENAARYNGNLMRMMAEGRGTPMAPRSPLLVYVFAMFNENLKPGPASERHYGLFKPDMTPAYPIRLSANYTSAGQPPPPPESGGYDGVDDSSSSYYIISAAAAAVERRWLGAAAIIIFWVLNLLN